MDILPPSPLPYQPQPETMFCPAPAGRGLKRQAELRSLFAREAAEAARPRRPRRCERCDIREVACRAHAWRLEPSGGRGGGGRGHASDTTNPVGRATKQPQAPENSSPSGTGVLAGLRALPPPHTHKNRTRHNTTSHNSEQEVGGQKTQDKGNPKTTGNRRMAAAIFIIEVPAPVGRSPPPPHK